MRGRAEREVAEQRSSWWSRFLAGFIVGVIAVGVIGLVLVAPGLLIARLLSGVWPSRELFLVLGAVVLATPVILGFRAALGGTESRASPREEGGAAGGRD